MAFVDVNTEQSTEPNEVRVYTSGVYDLFHVGYMRAFEKYKQMHPKTTLVVGILDPPNVACAMSLAERAAAVRGCKWVDEVICPCPNELTSEFLSSQAISKVIVTDRFDPSQESKEFVLLKSSDTLSTKELHQRLIREINDHAQDCLAQGYSAKQLGLTLTQRFFISSIPRQVVRKFTQIVNTVTRKKQAGSLGARIVQWMTRFSNSFDIHFMGEPYEES